MNELITLGSGLRLIVTPMEHTREVGICVYVGAGGIYETESNLGISHFIEHMVFKGTDKRPTAFSISQKADALGMSMNAYTCNLSTTFYTDSLDEYAEEGMDILSDMYFHPLFRPEDIEAEKNIVVEEILMDEDTPDTVGFELALDAQYGDHPIAHRVLGTVETVRSFSREDLLAYMHSFYTADNTVISIAGNITPERAKELVAQYFVFPEDRLKKIDTFTPDVSLQSLALSKFKEDLEQSCVHILMPYCSWRDEYADAGYLACEMLGTSMSSRLFQKLREEKGLVYSTYSHIAQGKRFGYLSVFFATSPANVKKAVLAVKEVFAEIRKGGFTEEEIAGAKRRHYAGTLLSWEDAMAVMRLCGRYAISLGENYDPHERIARVGAVTKEEVAAVVDRYFTFEQASASYVGKKMKIDLLNLLKGPEND